MKRRSVLAASLGFGALVGGQTADVGTDQSGAVRELRHDLESCRKKATARDQQQQLTIGELRRELRDVKEHQQTMSVFLVAGQSNAVGDGDAESSIVPGANAFDLMEWPVKHLTDPFANSWGGSAWPAFAAQYTRARPTEKIGLASAAVSGTAMHPDASATHGHWQADGDNLDSLRRVAADAREYLDRMGMNHRTRGILWMQGERDANAIDNGRITVDEYRTAFREFVPAIRDAVNNALSPIYIFQTGRPSSGDTDGFQAIRNAQFELADELDRVHLVSTSAKTLPEKGMMFNEHHYDQAGLNLLGLEAGKAVTSLVDEKYTLTNSD